MTWVGLETHMMEGKSWFTEAVLGQHARTHTYDKNKPEKQ